MPGGRPTKYCDEIIEKTEWYLENYSLEGDMIPSIAGLADYLNLNRDTLHTWAKDDGKKEFSDILVRLLARQERTLLNNGLNGEFNSAITKLALGKHGYSDKQDVDVKDVTPPTPEKRKSRIKDLLEKCKN